MGLFWRRSFKFGPLRLTASKSGLTTSIGVRGARVGVGPRGTYVSFSAGGVTYRRKLDNRPVRPPPTPPPATPLQASWDPGAIATASVDALATTSPDASLQELHERLSRFNWFKLYLWVGGIGSLFAGCLLSAALRPALFLVPPLAFGLLAIPVYLWDRERRTARLIYDVDDEELLVRLHLCNAAGAALASAARLWHVYSEVRTDDFKRHGGATNLVRRTAVRCTAGSLPHIECNIQPYAIPVGPQRLLFLPDRLLVQEGRKFAAVPYEHLDVEAQPIEFIEQEGVPPDARLLRTTWRYVNKSGGPDRRFSNNDMLPVVEYGRLTLRSQTGVMIQLDTSSLAAAQRAADALRELAARAAKTSARQPAAPAHAAPPPAFPVPAHPAPPAALPVLPHPPASQQPTPYQPASLPPAPYPPTPHPPAAPQPIPQPPIPRPITLLDQTRAVATVLRSLAAADRKLDPRELAHIAAAIAEAAASDETVRFQVLDELPKLRSSPDDVREAVAILAASAPHVRQRVLELAEALVTADGKTTPKEAEKLAELRQHLAT